MSLPLVTAQCGGLAGHTPLGGLVVEPELLQVVHDVGEFLPLLIDDITVIGQSVEQRFSLGNNQTPEWSRNKYSIIQNVIHQYHKHALFHQNIQAQNDTPKKECN